MRNNLGRKGRRFLHGKKNSGLKISLPFLPILIKSLNKNLNEYYKYGRAIQNS